MKICTDCGINKKNNEFYKGHLICKACGLERAKITRMYYNKPQPGYIYIIINPAWEEWVKIGRAGDPIKRLADYNTGAPLRDYELYFSISVDDMKIEHEIHKHFIEYRKLMNKNEWFKVAKEDALKYIVKYINKATHG